MPTVVAAVLMVARYGAAHAQDNEPAYRNADPPVEHRVEDLPARITLNPGETQSVTFNLGSDELSYHGLDMERVVEPGIFDIMVGPNSVDLNTTTFEVIP